MSFGEQKSAPKAVNQKRDLEMAVTSNVIFQFSVTEQIEAAKTFKFRLNGRISGRNRYCQFNGNQY